ncbi:MAG: all-trans-retinol 13,14-reductase, partial [Kiritimatiellia bacterium]
QHDVPGGFTHAFTRKGYTWDVGVHAVGEVTEHSMTGRLLRKLTDDRLKWTSLGSVYEHFHFPDGFRIDFPDKPEAYRASLIEAFPDEVQAIDAYLAKVHEVSSAMRGYYQARALPKGLAAVGSFLMARRADKAFELNTGEFIESLTDNPKLRTIFVAQWGYYGSPPSRSSFAIQALVVKHFKHGGYYPVGGSERIAVELLRTVSEQDGWTRVCADVDEIIIERNKVVGVRLEDGEVIQAKRVISAVGAVSTCKRLLPQAVADQKWARGIRGLPPSAAHVCLYIGFKGDIAAAGASAANQWFCETWDYEMQAWPIAQGQPIGRAPVLYCSFPSLKDPTHEAGDEVRHTGEVVTFVPWSAFTKWQDTEWRKRGDDYEAFKQALTDAMLEQYLQHMPQLRDLVDYVELSTPLSTDTFCRPTQGSIYGIEATPERFRNPYLRPATPVKGLFLAGSEIATVGVIGAMMGGVMSVMASEPRGAMKLLARK